MRCGRGRRRLAGPGCPTGSRLGRGSPRGVRMAGSCRRRTSAGAPGRVGLAAGVMSASFEYLLLRQVLQMLTQLARDGGAHDQVTKYGCPSKDRSS
jgi:hypothetical protein